MDTVTAVSLASSVANSQVVWSILCIGLTVYVLYSQKQEKKEWREERLQYVEIQKSFSDAITTQADTMKEISSSLKNLEGRMEKVERSTDRYSRGGG